MREVGARFPTSRELPRHEALARLRGRDRADGPCAKGGSGEPHQPFELTMKEQFVSDSTESFSVPRGCSLAGI